MIDIKPPGQVEFVLRRLTSAGHAAVIVGGCVRDSILKRCVHDWDLASSAKPEEVACLFDNTVMTGEKYGTVTVVFPESKVEVTTFRTEGGYDDGRRPGSVEFVTSLDEDLSRRDFTINAIAITIDGEVIDPFGGYEDLENRLIRCVGEPDIRFAEDALRMFRAFRFCAELGFDIEYGTLDSIRKNAGKAQLISAERIRDELEKTLISHKPEIAGEIIRAGLLEGRLPGTVEIPDNLGRLAALPDEPALRWCAFCAVLREKGLIGMAGGFLRGMRLNAKTVRNIESALSIPGFPDCRIEMKRFLAKHGSDAVRCAAAADDTLHGGKALSECDEVIRSGECFSLDALAVSGRDLISAGHPPGRDMGNTLADLLNHVIEHPEDNTRDALLGILNTTGY